MDWASITSIFLLSTVKFLLTPFTGIGLGVSFKDTYLSCTAGALLSAAIFYFSAEFLMIRTHKKKKLLIEQAKEKGIELKRKKVFTRTNKFIVRMKGLGIIAICFYAPLFLSMPIGSIISAKFFGKDNRTFPLIVLGIGINGLITTGIATLIATFF